MLMQILAAAFGKVADQFPADERMDVSTVLLARLLPEATGLLCCGKHRHAMLSPLH
jgi:hypothetical protein